MKYKNIIKILEKQVETNVKTLWTFDEKNLEFTQIYKNYTNELKIYTPQQLLDKLKQWSLFVTNVIRLKTYTKLSLQQ